MYVEIRKDLTDLVLDHAVFNNNIDIDVNGILVYVDSI